MESKLERVPFDATAARGFGLVVAAVLGESWRPWGRMADLLIAAIARANGLDLSTSNGDGFRRLGDLVRVVPI